MEKAKVYFTKEITEESLVKIYEKLGIELKGNVAKKLHSVRTARNDFAHDAIVPENQIVTLSATSFFEFLSLAYSDFKENHLFDDIAKKLIGNFYSDLHLFNTQQVTYEVTGWEDLVSSSN